MKSFTIYLDYSTSSPNPLSRIYIPPGLSTNPAISAGGIFSADIAGVLVFYGTNTISIQNTTYTIPIGLSGTGFSGTYWALTSYGNIGTGGRINFTSSSDYALTLTGLTVGYVNGGNTATRPTTGVLAGWLGTLTIYFL
jgi:hypothetical protein